MARDEFEVAFRELFPKASRVARRILGDTTSAEDVAAEALARAFASWHRFKDIPHLHAWVLKVTTNVCLDLIRKRRTLPDAGEVEDPEEVIALRSALHAALKTLPRRQREVIALRHLGGLSERETAEALGISIGSVKTQAHRALARLRLRFDPDLGPVNTDVD